MSLYKKITLPAATNPGLSTPKMYKGFSSVSTNSENFTLYDFDLMVKCKVKMESQPAAFTSICVGFADDV